MPRLLIFLLLFLIGTQAVQAAEQDADTPYIPDIETFLQIGSVSSPAISADGKRILFSSAMSGVNQVYRLTDQGWPYQLTAYQDGVDFYALAPDGQALIVGASVGGDEQSQLYLLDAMTGRPRQLTDRPDVQYASVIWAPDSRSIVYRSNEANGRDFHLYRIDVASGQSTRIYQAAGYNVPAALSRDGRWLLVTHYESNENTDLYLVDLKHRSKARLLSDHDGAAQYIGVGFLPGDKQALLVSNDNVDGILRPLLIDLDSGDYSSPLGDSAWEVEGGVLSDNGSLAGIIYNEEGYGRLRLYDTEDFRELPAPALDGIVADLALSDRGQALIAFSSPTRAPDIWLWDWDRPELRQLTQTTYAGIDRALFNEPQLVKIESFDGLEIPAFLYLPPGYKKGAPIPFVIEFHGGPESQFRPYFIRNFQYMMLNGYGVLAPNVRGSSGYGRQYMALDNYRRRMDSVKDGGEYARWLISEAYTTAEMLGVRGGSYGGFMVLACITEFPELFAAAIDTVGIANFQSFLENTSAYRRHLREAEYGPLSDPEFLAQISPIHKVDRIRTPLLVVHGENDPRVPVSEARQIADAIREQGGDVETLIFPDEGHGTAKRVNVLKEYRTHVDFFDRYLKPGGQG